MYKFTSYLSNSHLVLVRKKLSDGSCAALVVMRAPVRRYAKEHFETCPPATPPPKSRKLLWGTIGATVLTGAGIVYAKNTPDVRNWLETNVPWAHNFIALIYQEDTTYLKFTQDKVGKMSTFLSNFIFGEQGVTPMELPPRSQQDLDKEAAKGFQPKEYQLPPQQLSKLYVPEKVISTPEVTYEATLVQTDKCDPQEPPAVSITNEIVQVEKDMFANTKIAVDNSKKAVKLCMDYAKALFKIVEMPITGLDKRMFESLKALRESRDKAINTANEATEKARHAIEALDAMIEASGIQAPPENVAQTKRYIKKFRADLEVAEKELTEEYSKAVISDKYWDKVEAARNMYKNELEMLFPGIDLCDRQLKLQGDTDLLLLYTMKQIQYLQNELAEIQTIREQKISKALECRDEDALIAAKIEDMIKQDRRLKELEYMKKSLEMTAESNRKLKEELRKQYEMQEQLAQSRLAKKEAEIMGKFTRSVSELVEKERVTFKKELAAMAGKMKAIEQALKKRANAEAEAKKSQSIWAAAEALLAATRRPQPDVKIDNELKALENAGQGDKLVASVLKGIPPEARENGIITEKALRDRFDSLEQTATKVALVGKEGASLPTYFLSWLQSKLLFPRLAAIPQNELDDCPTDFSKLDTFDIIQRARYHIDHGDIPSALRYVNLLQGGARAAAARWAGAARAHLEVRQAAEAVMAHAALSGLLDQ